MFLQSILQSVYHARVSIRKLTWYTESMIRMIVARAQNGVIGDEGGLPWHLPKDLAYFKEKTRGKTVVMGRKTFESIVRYLGKPLPGRKSVVMTRNLDWSYKDVRVIYDYEDALSLGDIWIIGGSSIYEQFMPYADELYVTEVKADIDGDTILPPVSKRWQEVSRVSNDADDDHAYAFDFVRYKRNMA